MKKLISFTSHYELRRRTTYKCSGSVKTDPSFKKSCDINNIVNSYKKTGVLSGNRPHLGQYIDASSVPTLETAFEASNLALNEFMKLPATLRKLIDNDPSKLESFLLDEKNHKLLVEHGVLEVKQKPKFYNQLSDKKNNKKSEVDNAKKTNTETSTDS